MTRRRRFVLVAVAVATFLALSPARRAGACNDGRAAPGCPTTTISGPLIDRVITTTTAPPAVIVVDAPPVDVVETRAARAPEPAVAVAAVPAFAG